MLPNRLGISKIMVLPDEIIEELFLRCSANLAEFDWCKLRQGALERDRLVFQSYMGMLFPPRGIIVVVKDSWRKS